MAQGRHPARGRDHGSYSRPRAAFGIASGFPYRCDLTWEEVLDLHVPRVIGMDIRNAGRREVGDYCATALARLEVYACRRTAIEAMLDVYLMRRRSGEEDEDERCGEGLSYHDAQSYTVGRMHPGTLDSVIHVTPCSSSARGINPQQDFPNDDLVTDCPERSQPYSHAGHVPIRAGAHEAHEV